MHTRVVIGPVETPVRFCCGLDEYRVGCVGDGVGDKLGPLLLKANAGLVRPCTDEERTVILSSIVQRDDRRRAYLPTYRHVRIGQSDWWQMEVNSLPNQSVAAAAPVPASTASGGEAVA